jgi:hypothetical protein
MVIFFLVLVSSCCWFFWYVSTPSVGKVKLNTDLLTTPTPIDIFSFDGAYFSFKYNNNYELRHNEIEDKTLIDQVTLWGKSGFFDQIITYRPSTINRIDEVSAVQMRRQKPDQYIEKKINIDGIPGLLFETKDKVEFAVVVLNGDKVLSIGLSTNSNDREKYLVEMNRTLESFRWKK